jgi:hypothetical protein
MKTSTASANCRRICSAPCQSILVDQHLQLLAQIDRQLGIVFHHVALVEGLAHPQADPD